MSTYTLSGSGLQALSVGVGALIVSVITQPPAVGNGGANPPDLFGVGTLRPGNATAFWEPFTVCGGPQWMPVPYGSTRLGYSFAPSVVVTVTEIIGSPPFAFPLASLPDVTLASPADTQVLTFQASSQKWINAAAPSGGGGGTGAVLKYDEQLLLANAATVRIPASGSIPSTYRHMHVVMMGRTTQSAVATGSRCQVNGDSGANYDTTAIDGHGVGTGLGIVNAGNSLDCGALTGATGPANYAGTVECLFFNYSGSTFYKQCQVDGAEMQTINNASYYRRMIGTVWRNTAPITSLTFFPSSGSYLAGSLFTTYLF